MLSVSCKILRKGYKIMLRECIVMVGLFYWEEFMILIREFLDEKEGILLLIIFILLV